MKEVGAEVDDVGDLKLEEGKEGGRHCLLATIGTFITSEGEGLNNQE